ncbi:MAG: ISAs1 family transposase [Tannerella sp.]|jgi:hypothetical protein|nr:ISAs1 family transposase [Tannerella sp.]
MESSLSYFSNLRDPRVERTREHNLEDIMFIAIASIICGGEGWYKKEEFGKAKEEWLKTFLRLQEGIPSHDTFNRVFSALVAEELEKGFVGWTQAVAKLSEGEVVAVEGKSMRGTGEQGNKSIVHMVNAWERVVLKRGLLFFVKIIVFYISPYPIFFHQRVILTA